MNETEIHSLFVNQITSGLFRMLWIVSGMIGLLSPVMADSGQRLTPITLTLADFKTLAAAADFIFIKSVVSAPAGSGLRFNSYAFSQHATDGVGIITDGSIIYEYESRHTRKSMEKFAGNITRLPQDPAHLKGLEPHLGAVKAMIVMDLGVVLGLPPGGSIGGVEEKIGAGALKSVAAECLKPYKTKMLDHGVLINFPAENLMLSCGVTLGDFLIFKWATRETTMALRSSSSHS
jgi:hypothetical protein